VAGTSGSTTKAMERLYVYGDESGDTGFKFPPLHPAGGSSFHFTTATIATSDAMNLSDLVDDYRSSLRWPSYREFKFSNMDDDQRKEFLQFVRGLHFEAQVLVTRKIPPAQWKREGFYELMLRDALAQCGTTVNDAIVMWDESVKAPSFKQRVKTYLRQELNINGRRIMHEMSFGRSHSHSMLQLADVVASSVQRVHEDSDDRFQKIIAKRICVRCR
jgi:hypothetical protein